jgi:multiple sugar transport system permease protein
MARGQKEPAVAAGPSPPRRRWTSSSLSEAQFAYLIVIPLAAVLVALIAYPVGDTFWTSLHKINPSIGINRFAGLYQYRRALSDPAVHHALKITLYYSLLVTVMCCSISFGAASLLNRPFVGRRLLTIIVVLPFALSTYATAVVWRYMYSPDFGFINAIVTRFGLDAIPFLGVGWALFAVALAHSWQLAPVGTYFILASLQVIPEDLYRTARSDGLGKVQQFRHVTFPYIRYAILITLILVTVEAARVFDIVYFMTGGGPGDDTRGLAYEIYARSFTLFDFGYGAAISYLLLLIITVITLLYFALLYARRKERV